VDRACGRVLAGCIQLPKFTSVNERALDRYARAAKINPENPHAWFARWAGRIWRRANFPRRQKTFRAPRT
jgi:hypothetical protein